MVPLQAYVDEKILKKEQIDSLADLVRNTLQLDWVLSLAREKILSTEQLMSLNRSACLVLRYVKLHKLLKENLLSVECLLNLNLFSQRILSLRRVQLLLQKGILNTAHIMQITDDTHGISEDRAASQQTGYAYINLFISAKINYVLSEKLFTPEELFAWPNYLKMQLDEIYIILTKKLLTKPELFSLKPAAASLLKHGMLGHLMEQNIVTVTSLNQLSDEQIHGIATAISINGYAGVSLIHLMFHSPQHETASSDPKGRAALSPP